jgi:PAS domain S-box-containing protein
MGPMSDGERAPRNVDEQAALRAVVEGTAGDTGVEFFAALVKNLARALDVHGAWVTEYLEDQRRLRALAFWLGDAFVPDYEYDIEGTPCAPVITELRLLHVPDRVVELFPEDPDLPKLSAVSYMGIPLLDLDGRILGHLAVLDTRSMPEDPRLFDLLRIFANRAVAELGRLRVEREVREREEKLGLLVDCAMDAIVELNHELDITRANPAAEQLFGCGRDALLDRPITKLLSQKGKERLSGVMDDLEQRRPGERYLWIAGGLAACKDNGEPFHAEATMSTFQMGGQEFYTLILRNVNDRLEAERRIQRLEEQTTYLREEINTLRQFDRILGTSPALLSVLKEVDQVSVTDTTVLILGETGTGKELIARAIHEGSRRRRAPLINLNCAAIPANLIESELFGHERGAFTGATHRRDGRFTLADGGTLFLDEVGELPLELQGKLLRVLQEGEFEPVGSARTRKVDVRLIAATNRDLKAETAEGRFREDLFYRLNVFPIRLPALRERGDDVVELATEFARRFAHDMGKELEPFDEVVKQRLCSYAWPGNIRELQNVIERAVITARSGRLDFDRALPESTRASAETSPTFAPVGSDDRIRTVDEMRDLERTNIVRALEASGWKVAGQHGAARRLGMYPSTLNSRMNAFGIRRPQR